ncbi:formyl-CoA transferase [Bradyrhizobium japonicum]|uniref:CaiB/BaiF CoA transferase family protein n=1 Tax=Bradyrhizobium japonicum TaxID=375 RepID=UPI002166C453|nr:CoA transferase [Bradyrhizobium japonicum]MCS3496161.1 formyl-CoA transferase [Bradyrhizobium japonicum]MCS3961677.1 formyl-CoA transferase [Bradyrhizobium japonicum]MCS3993994.1 formyl-CoA transferase [Bradyrhizobium japonicum]
MNSIPPNAQFDDRPLFSGLKVLDIASFIAGPAATTVLSDFGAEVIKIEAPGAGDPHRHTYMSPPNPSSKENYAWQIANRNKRSVVVDLKNPHAAEVFARLVKWADVLVTNFPPRVRQRLGLNYEDVSLLNPRLIYADITGYGELGLEADKPGFDTTAYWARSGLMHVTREASSPPALPVPGIGDHATSISLYAGIVSGLYRRERTGTGCNVQTSLIANGVWGSAMWLQAALQNARFSGGIDRRRPPNALFNSYQSHDCRWILLAFVQEDKNWPAFAQAIKRPDLLADPRFADAEGRHVNSGALVTELDHVFGAHPLAHWRSALDVAHVPYGVVQVWEEIVKDPQLLANQILVPIAKRDGRVTMTVDSPVVIKESPKVAPRVAPDLGEHTDEVLEELGFDAAQIDELRAAGAVPIWPLKAAGVGSK